MGFGGVAGRADRLISTIGLRFVKAFKINNQGYGAIYDETSKYQQYAQLSFASFKSTIRVDDREKQNDESP